MLRLHQWQFVVSSEIGIKSTSCFEGVVVGLNGVRAYSPAWANCLPGTGVSGVEWDKRGHNSGMTPVNRKAGTGERTRELPWGNARDLIVLSGFATTDLSVRFRDACQGAEPMEKRPPCGLSFYITRPFGFRALYACHSCRSPQPNGSERSDWVSEEAEREHPYIEHWRSEAPYDETTENSAEHG